MKSIRTVTHLPPREQDWTPWEHNQFVSLLLNLKQCGVDATRYEWRTDNELWCCFRQRNGPALADVTRSNRTYFIQIRGSTIERAFDLAAALAIILRKCRLRHIREEPSPLFRLSSTGDLAAGTYRHYYRQRGSLRPQCPCVAK